MINAVAILHLKFYSTEGGCKTFCFWQKKLKIDIPFSLKMLKNSCFLPMSQVLAKLISALFLHTYEAHMRGNGAPSSVQGIKKP